MLSCEQVMRTKKVIVRGYSLDKTPNSPCFIYKKLYRSQKGEILIGSWDLKSYVLTGISFSYYNNDFS